MVGGAWPDVRRAAVGTRVTAEEPHVATYPAQSHQRLADPGVVQVALAVDEEEVAAEPGAGRTRLDGGQVDPPDRELGEDLHQGPRVILT